MSAHRLEVVGDAEAVARRGAELIREAAVRAHEERGAFSLAASGGSAPWKMYAQLEDGELPWAGTEIFQVDERVANLFEYGFVELGLFACELQLDLFS